MTSSIHPFISQSPLLHVLPSTSGVPRGPCSGRGSVQGRQARGGIHHFLASHYQTASHSWKMPMQAEKESFQYAFYCLEHT